MEERILLLDRKKKGWGGGVAKMKRINGVCVCDEWMDWMKNKIPCCNAQSRHTHLRHRLTAYCIGALSVYVRPAWHRHNLPLCLWIGGYIVCALVLERWKTVVTYLWWVRGGGDNCCSASKGVILFSMAVDSCRIGGKGVEDTENGEAFHSQNLFSKNLQYGTNRAYYNKFRA